MRNPWILSRPGRSAGSVRLVCLPHAGSGAAAYLGWSTALGPGVDLLPVQLPGRESRLAEAAVSAMDVLLPPLADALTGELHGTDKRPYVLYGHSMGALVAFHLACEFRRRGLRLPCQLVVSGARAPHLPPLEPLLHQLPDGPLLLEVNRRYGGGFDPDMRELVELMLPTLRADLTLVETRKLAEAPPLPLPIASWAGADDVFVPLADAREWGRHSSGEFEFKVFPGGHFFPSTARPAFLQQLARVLAPHITAAS